MQTIPANACLMYCTSFHSYVRLAPPAQLRTGQVGHATETENLDNWSKISKRRIRKPAKMAGFLFRHIRNYYHIIVLGQESIAGGTVYFL